MAEAFEQMSENFTNKAGNSPYADPEDSELVANAKEIQHESQLYSFTEKDIILYNLSIGATEKELQWTFENTEDFAPLPTFGVIPQFETSYTLPLDWLPDYNHVSLVFPDVTMQA